MGLFSCIKDHQGVSGLGQCFVYWVGLWVFRDKSLFSHWIELDRWCADISTGGLTKCPSTKLASMVTVAFWCCVSMSSYSFTSIEKVQKNFGITCSVLYFVMKHFESGLELAAVRSGTYHSMPSQTEFA